MTWKLFDFLKKKKLVLEQVEDKRLDESEVEDEVGKEENGLNSGFLKGVSFDENMFEEETPDNVDVFDLDGNKIGG